MGSGWIYALHSPFSLTQTDYHMASGRVGGTKSKVSGAVGNEVYSLRRNADGTYSQIVSAKSDTPYTSNSDKQAAYRMGTAIVEALMRDIKEVGCISMQSGANRSKSLNALSSMNLNRVYKDIREHWDTKGLFQYNTKGKDAHCGGKFLISSGNLMENHFSGLESGYLFPQWGRNPDGSMPANVSEYSVIKWEIPAVCDTIGKLLKHFRMTRRDMFGYANFHLIEYEDPASDPDDPQIIEDYRYRWMIIRINDFLSDTTPITKESLDSLFLVESSDQMTRIWQDYYRVYGVGEVVPIPEILDNIIAHAAFTISYPWGRKAISYSELSPTYHNDMFPWYGHKPCDVYWSYLNNQDEAVLPSPF